MENDLNQFPGFRVDMIQIQRSIQQKESLNNSVCYLKFAKDINSVAKVYTLCVTNNTIIKWLLINQPINHSY